MGRSILLRGGGGIHSDLFYHITSFENLYGAWREFKRCKGKKQEIQVFEFNLETNLSLLSKQLREKIYTPEPYVPFYVYDPKRRHIHKATVRDRVVHQALYRILAPIFETQFIDDSFACRVGKGTHRGVLRLESFLQRASNNSKKTAWALKCDVKKFFDSIDHDILRTQIVRRVMDENVLWLVDIILHSFEKEKGKGLPLGNVTSQLFGNIYLHELDRYIKHELQIKQYVRYCDDFVIVAKERSILEMLIPKIADFLGKELQLVLHTRKVIIRKYGQGVDFLGYVLRPHHKTLRTSTKKRMFAKSKLDITKEQRASYLGIFSHSKSNSLKRKLLSLSK